MHNDSPSDNSARVRFHGYDSQKPRVIKINMAIGLPLVTNVFEYFHGLFPYTFKVLINNELMLKIARFFLNGACIIILKPKGFPGFLVGNFISPAVTV
jgi:hypothetical protein